jgi:hypothetical protein
MRSFQKKLMATASTAVLVAAVGAAWAQSSDATAPVTTGPSDTSLAPAADNAVRYVAPNGTPSSSSSMSTNNSSSANTSNANTNGSNNANTDTSSTDAAPAPRADRN